MPGSGQVGFVVDKVALGQVFSEYFCFPCQIIHPSDYSISASFRILLQIIIH
jgi:hypothetical protein